MSPINLKKQTCTFYAFSMFVALSLMIVIRVYCWWLPSTQGKSFGMGGFSFAMFYWQRVTSNHQYCWWLLVMMSLLANICCSFQENRYRQPPFIARGNEPSIFIMVVDDMSLLMTIISHGSSIHNCEPFPLVVLVVVVDNESSVNHYIPLLYSLLLTAVANTI